MLKTQPPRPICINCNNALAKFNGLSKKGFKRWHCYCVHCAKTIYDKRFNHLKTKKLKCEKCNFVPVDRCQLDVVFKDGNKKNKNQENLQTLCANCSRLHRKKIKKMKSSVMNITVDMDVRIS